MVHWWALFALETLDRQRLKRVHIGQIFLIHSLFHLQALRGIAKVFLARTHVVDSQFHNYYIIFEFSNKLLKLNRNLDRINE